MNRRTYSFMTTAKIIRITGGQIIGHPTSSGKLKGRSR